MTSCNLCNAHAALAITPVTPDNQPEIYLIVGAATMALTIRAKMPICERHKRLIAASLRTAVREIRRTEAEFAAS